MDFFFLKALLLTIFIISELYWRLHIRLLNIRHLYGIWTGLTPYRLRLDTISEYPEPWFWKISGSEWERTCKLKCSEKNRVPDMGEKWCKKNRVQEFLDSGFFPAQFTPMPGTLFFFRTLKLASPLSLTSWNFSGSGFWILTKGVKRQPVRSQTRLKSI